MNKGTVTFRLDSQKRKAIDAIASGLDRDRSYVINQAINAYLETYRWQVDHIREGIRQANAGLFVADAEVEKAFKKWRS